MHNKIAKTSVISCKIILKKFKKKLEKIGFIPYNKQCCDIDSVEA